MISHFPVSRSSPNCRYYQCNLTVGLTFRAHVMALILQIIGGFVLSIIVLIFCIYLYFRFKFGKFFNFDPDKNQTPLVIHLNEDHSPDWLSEKEASRAFEQLCNLGFQRGKAYTIFEMPDYQLISLFNHPYVAVLYQHPVAGVWIDYFTIQENGKELTVSNAPYADFAKENRPLTEKIFNKDGTIEELFETLKQASGDAEFVKIDNTNFRQIFEEAFNKDTAWRNRNGGISYEEFEKIEKYSNWKNDEKTKREVFLDCKENELEQWHEAGLRVYQEKNSIKDEEFIDGEYLLFIVPVKTDASAFIRYLTGMGFLPDEQEEKLMKLYGKETDIYTLFDTLNNALSPELRAEMIATIDYPIEAKIFKQKEEYRQYNYNYK